MEPFSTFHLEQWLEKNRELFAPPYKTNRLLVHEKDFMVMILRGPNTRLDFHVEPGDEFFYQIEGDIELHVKQVGEPRQVIKIRQGEIFLCPGGLAHSPRRAAETWGLVIERKRRPDENEEFVWFCEKCDEKVTSETVAQGNIAAQVARIYEAFNADARLRTCGSCGYVFPLTPMAERLGFLEAKSNRLVESGCVGLSTVMSAGTWRNRFQTIICPPVQEHSNVILNTRACPFLRKCGNVPQKSSRIVHSHQRRRRLSHVDSQTAQSANLPHCRAAATGR